MNHKIGNIIYNNNFLEKDNIEFINYIDISKEKEFNNNLPIVYVSWSLTKSLYPDQDILNNKIEKNKKYWIYSFEEDPVKFYKQYNSLIKKFPEYYFNQYKIIILDPVFNNFKSVDFILDKIFNVEKGYIVNSCFYLLDDKNVYIINFDQLNFFGIKTGEILKFLDEKKIKYFYDETKQILNTYVNYFNNYSKIEKFIVTVLN